MDYKFKYQQALKRAKKHYNNKDETVNTILKDIFPELIVKTTSKDSFFLELAEALRTLWPAGEKDGKWPWRDSVQNIKIRLELLWEVRELKDYTIDECLTVARRYLNQFEDSVKYMKTLKYFILRQNEKVSSTNGSTHYVNQSVFADMLEGQSSFESTSDWESVFETSNTIEQGELI